MHPTMVVPVEVAFGSGNPLACSAALRVWFEKSKPGMMKDERRFADSMDRCWRALGVIKVDAGRGASVWKQPL